MSRSSVERELKIPVADLEPVRSELTRHGARRIHSRRFEDNLLLDTPSGELRASGRVLRVRRTGGRSLITLKGRASFRGPVKQRSEVELEIGDADRMLALLVELGFGVAARYQKERECWQLDAAVVALDHTPMGDFVEIEGPGDLEAAARRLDLDPENAARASYLELWHDFRADRPEAELPESMVFTR